MDKNNLLEKLNDYLCERYNEKKRHAEFIWGKKKIIAETKKFKLFFRLRPPRNVWKQQTLVIGRIYFSQKRSGHGRDLLRFINNCCNGLGYKNIGIEDVWDDETKNFAGKMGFTPWREDNYIISCDELAKTLT